MNKAAQKWLTMGLILALLVSAMAIVAVRQLNRVGFYQSEKLQAQRDNLSIEWRQLMAEYSTWRLEHKVEKEVRGDSGLNPPQGEQLQTLELAEARKP